METTIKHRYNIEQTLYTIDNNAKIKLHVINRIEIQYINSIERGETCCVFYDLDTHRNQGFTEQELDENFFENPEEIVKLTKQSYENIISNPEKR